MSRLLPVSHRELIRRLKRIGFQGPYGGGKHLVMVRSLQRVVVPNPHHGDIDVGLLRTILREAGISRDEWERSA